MRCDQCKWWDERKEGKLNYGRTTGQSQAGLCRINPPTPMVVGHAARRPWPTTYREDWCGKFEKKT
jgi:hypothetical protein